MGNKIALQEWINPLYLTPQTLQQIHTAFSQAQPFPFIQLGNFLLEQKAESLRTALLKAKKVETYIPHMHSYSTIKEDKTIAAYKEFFENSGFLTLLGTMIKQPCKKATVSCKSFEQRNYTLLHDTVQQKEGIYCFLDVTKDWPAQANGQTIFVSETGAEPVIFSRAWNTLNIVKRTANTHSFVKYVNAAAGNKEVLLMELHVE